MDAVQKLDAMDQLLETLPELLLEVKSIKSKVDKLQSSFDEANLKLEELTAKVDAVDKHTANNDEVPATKQDQQKSPTINYGVGMACSFFEGYLTNIIPSEGTASSAGFEWNIRQFQAQQGIVFPVQRLFIVITKSLYCPPCLDDFNKPNRLDLPRLERIQSLEVVAKDVAGVKDRKYQNSAYKIDRPGKPPVHLAAEFATPLHTLHKVLKKRAVYNELCDANVEDMVNEFCEQLKRIITASPDCRGKCELVHYDDTDEKQNLADVLLAKIEEIEPNFETVIKSRAR